MPRPLVRLLCCLFLSAWSLLPSSCTHSTSYHDQAPSDAPASEQKRPMLELSGKSMGSAWHATLIVTSATTGSDIAETMGAIQQALDRVDGRMSTYKPDSEISRFAAASAEQDFPVSAETAAVVREALRILALSDGAFDPTVMPLVNLWGFGPADTKPTAPSAAELQDALAICGWQKLQVSAFNQLRKSVDALQLDLSAIAKGYGVDAVCAALEEDGWSEYMVEVGGELRTSGKSPSGTAWRIGIDAPQDLSNAGQNLQAVLELGSIAVATSGDYRNFRYVDGERVSHTIDPRTGQPVQHALASVTILAPNCMYADALATTCMVLGSEAGLKLIETLEDAECYMILRDGEVLTTKQSSGFPQLQN